MVFAAVDIGKEFGPAQKFGTLASFLNVIVPNLLLLAGVILFILLVVGGLMVIVGAGKGEGEQVGRGQKAVTYALIGFIIIFASWWIIRIIERLTGVSILQPSF